MEPIYRTTLIHLGGAVAVSFALAACIPQTEAVGARPGPSPAPPSAQTAVPPPAPVATPDPAPEPASAPAPQTTATPVVQPISYEDYFDVPVTPGDWEYVSEPGESLGFFGDANPVHLFVLRCEKTTRQIGIARRGTSDRPLAMRVRTETSERVLTASQVPGIGLVAAALTSSDPLLDAMAITKGHFVIEVEGMETLAIPAWAEVTRVIEDCR